MNSKCSISISVIVPVYSGEQFLFELVQRLDKLRTLWIERAAPMRLAELILVDDAAIDESPAIAQKLAAEHQWINSIHLMRNFGQHAATVAGVLHSSGDWVVTMDEDLQHSPAEIEQLLERAAHSGADIVYAKPRSAVHELRSRDWTSRGFKSAMVLLTGDANIAHFNSFRLLRGSLARAASSTCGPETYFDIALSWFTNRIQFVSLDLKDQRFIAGNKSGYSFFRLLTHARRMLISSQVKAMRVFGLIGILIVGTSMIAGVAILVAKLIAPSAIGVVGWTSLMLIILFFGGFITFMIAIMLEYISVLVLSAHGKPRFFLVDRSSDKELIEYFRSTRA